MAKRKKYYTVWEGHSTGVFDNWEECQKQIKNFPGAKYKSFKTKEEAEQAFYGNYHDHLAKKKEKKGQKDLSFYSDVIVKNSIAVDAACSGNPGLMEYRGVFTFTKDEIFKQGPYPDGTNNIGEFLALVHALAMLKKSNKEEISIYTDSRTAMAWVRKKKANTKLQQTSKNTILFELISRAEKWLKTNSYRNPILKWDTDNWGEIPADFGRK